MTELYLDRKLKHECTRGCGRPAARDSQMCQACGEVQREHQRRSAAFIRLLRRDNELCADCGAWSGERYRCQECARQSADGKKLWRAGRVGAE